MSLHLSDEIVGAHAATSQLRSSPKNIYTRWPSTASRRRQSADVKMKKCMKRAARAARAHRPTFVVDGARYCAPYRLWWHSGFPGAVHAFPHGPIPLPEALGAYCKVNEGNSAALQIEPWSLACGRGHVQLKRQREDIAFWTADSSTLASKGDQYKVLLCVHEPPVTAELPTVLHESDGFLVVDKPAGLPTVGVCSGASLCVEGVLAEADAALYPGHRLDKPVSGVLILCRSTKNQSRVMQAAGGVGRTAGAKAANKSYVARVRPAMSSPLRDVSHSRPQTLAVAALAWSLRCLRLLSCLSP